MKATQIRTITVVIRDNSYFDIFAGERLVTDLCWDEFLGTIAVITHPQLSLVRDIVPPFARLQHIDQHIEKMVYYAQKRHAEKGIQFSPEEAEKYRSSAFYSLPTFSERSDPPALRALDEAIFQRHVSEWRAERYAAPRLLTSQSNRSSHGQ